MSTAPFDRGWGTRAGSERARRVATALLLCVGMVVIPLVALGASGGAAARAGSSTGVRSRAARSPRDTQRSVFAAQVALALERDLALVVHTRDAWADTLGVLDDVGVPARTVIHCFSGGPDQARACLDRGAALSFSGIVTFKNAADVRDAARLCPLDRLLVETDAPFLAPVPHRGHVNEPAWVALVGGAVAAARGTPVAEVEEATWANTERLFGLG